MKLEDQVCSLELAKELKKLGIKHTGITWISCCWVKYIQEKDYKLSLYEHLGHPDEIVDMIWSPNVAELGELLPLDCKTVRDEHVECGAVYFCEFRNKHFIDNTEANARTKMLIHLIEKGIIKL